MRSAIATLALLAAPLHVLGAQGDAMQCRRSGALITMDELAEASGIAASRRNAGVLWAINDSGDPVIYALDAKGVVTDLIEIHISGPYKFPRKR